MGKNIILLKYNIISKRIKLKKEKINIFKSKQIKKIGNSRKKMSLNLKKKIQRSRTKKKN